TGVQTCALPIYGHERGQNQQRFIGNRTQERSRGSLEGRLNAGWHADLLPCFVDCGGRSAKGRARRTVERDGDNWELALMIDGQRRCPSFKSRKRAERHLLASRGAHVNIFQGGGSLAKTFVDFHYHVILIELRENGGDLPLAEGVVERVVNVGGQNAEARGGVAVDGQRGEQAVVQLVGGNVAQVRQCLQFLHKFWRPVREF